MNGLAATFTGLRQASNQAAGQLWLEALSSSRRFIRLQAFEAAIHGAPLDIQTSIFLNWQELKPVERELIGENLSQFLPGLKASLDSSNEILRSNVFSIILSKEVFSLIPDLVKLIESSKETGGGSVGRILIRLTEIMASSLEDYEASGSDAPEVTLLSQTRECLTQSLKNFHHHQRTEILASFFNMTALDSPILHEVLHEPSSKALTLAAEVIARRRFIDIPNRLLIDYLSIQHAPALIQQLWQTRSEQEFIRGFLDTIQGNPSPHCESHLQALRQPNWHSSLELSSLRLTTQQQEGLAHLLEDAIVDEQVKRQTWQKLIVDGADSIFERAVDQLMSDPSAETDSLLISLAHHRQPKIRAAAIRRIPERPLLDADEILFLALDDSDPDVVKAAQSGLQKYTLTSYLKNPLELNEAQKKLARRVINKIEPDVTERLHEQLKDDRTGNIINAVQVTIGLNQCAALEGDLVDLLNHNSAEIRSLACEALGNCPSATVIHHLNLRLEDDAPEVRSLAQASLQGFESLETRTELTSTENSQPNEIVETS